MSVTARRAAPKHHVTATQHRHKEQVLTQPTPSKVRESASAIVLKVEDVFLLTAIGGDSPCDIEHGLGLFYADCRFLDEYELTINGQTPTVLSASASRGYETRHDLSNPDLRELPKNTLGIRRQRLVRDRTLLEIVTIRNFGNARARFQIGLRFGSDFEDIFMLRGYVPQKPGHEILPTVVHRDGVQLRSHGLDGAIRTTSISFAPRPDEVKKDNAHYDLELDPQEQTMLTIAIRPTIESAELEHSRPGAHPEARAIDIRRAAEEASGWLEQQERTWLSQWCEVRSSNALFDAVIERGLRDLRLLRTSYRGYHFEAAGIPWFGTLFGRDSAIVGLQMLMYGTGIARDTLRLLARFQATAEDRYRDAEPGKILHELRVGELARARLVPHSPAYYGTVDATLLFLIVLAEYLDWSGDEALVRDLLPNVRAALAWSLERADHDGDGFLDYSGEYENGLVNQGWKDSGNGIVNADGSLARPPIALAEVQSYAYRAWRACARVLRCLGLDADLADDLDRRAHALRVRFEERFWSDDLGCYVMALQRDGEPCLVASSNAGQVLWGGIASPEHARRIARRLLEDDLFSGWGIRTLSAATRAYNPIGYHLGTVWPQDNAMILAGFRHYGCDEAASRVFDALLAAATGMRDYRKAELYCGYGRKSDERRPVEYPVACSPQAWAAGALPYSLYRMLGLEADAKTKTLRIVRPQLPRNVDWLELRRMRLGDASLELRFQRDGDRVAYDAQVTNGDLRVEAA